MTKVFVIYNPSERYWEYYYYDYQKYRSTVQGFEDHIVAEGHAQEKFNGLAKILYK